MRDENRHAVLRVARPRCFLLHALAPIGMPPADANRRFNAFIADRRLPLVLFHDHFLGRPGGVAIFYAATAAERDMLVNDASLRDWDVDIRPLVFSYSPAAFDEQAAFTLREYRQVDWEALQRDRRPSYGNSAREAEIAAEDEP